MVRKGYPAQRDLVQCARRAHVLTGESPEAAWQREGHSRIPRVSVVTPNLKEGVCKAPT